MTPTTQVGLMDNQTLLIAFLAGCLVAGIVGFVLQQIHLSRADAQAFDQPMTIMLTTAQTPRQVQAMASAGRMTMLFWYGFLLMLVCILVIVGPEVLQGISSAAPGAPTYPFP